MRAKTKIKIEFATEANIQQSHLFNSEIKLQFSRARTRQFSCLLNGPIQPPICNVWVDESLSHPGFAHYARVNGFARAQKQWRPRSKCSLPERQKTAQVLQAKCWLSSFVFPSRKVPFSWCNTHGTPQWLLGLPPDLTS